MNYEEIYELCSTEYLKGYTDGYLDGWDRGYDDCNDYYKKENI